MNKDLIRQGEKSFQFSSNRFISNKTQLIETSVLHLCVRTNRENAALSSKTNFYKTQIT